MNILELDEMKQVIKESPATTFLIMVLILSFVGSYLFGDGPTDLDTARLFGSIIPADATTDHFIRTLTYTFHQIGGPMHLLLNLSAIAVTGPFLERVYGPFKYTIFFLVTGIFGGLFVLIFSEANMIVGGASGSAYGLIGLYVGLVLKKSPWIDLATKNWVWNLLWINIVWTLFVPGISIAGHLGGLFSGIIIAMLTSVNGIIINKWFKGFSKSVFAFALILILMNIPKMMYPNTELPFVQGMREMAGNESAFAMQPLFNDELFYSFSTVDSENEPLKINAEEVEQDTSEVAKGAEGEKPIVNQEENEKNISDTLYYYI